MFEKYFRDKRGESDKLYATLTRVIVYSIIFLIVLYFIWKQSTGATVYEQVYAKEIALLLDKAKAGTTLKLDFEKGYDIAEKNGVLIGDSVLINDAASEIIVRLDLKGGYRQYYFSNYKIDKQFDDINKMLILKISEK